MSPHNSTTSPKANYLEQIGIVVIGRNEGERLKKSLNSVINENDCLVYVDSGSTDGSVSFARNLGVEVIELDPSISFSAARAYNTGLEHLLTLKPSLKFVQFLDGDAILVDGWLETASQELINHPNVAVVCGRRREEFPEKSLYNQLSELEWTTPIGEVKECGPEAMMRISSFLEVGGFNSILIAGEEPELCYRIREKGGKIIRLDAETSLHDVQMEYFSQWWQRCRRGGFAYAEEAWLHGFSTELYRVKQSLSIWFWTLCLPCVVFLIFWQTGLWCLAILTVAYLILLGKTYVSSRQKRKINHKSAILYAIFCFIGKIPELIGQIEFIFRKLIGKRRSLIEYKVVKDGKTA